MKNQKNNWSEEDLKTYLFLFCTHADYDEKMELIKSNIDKNQFHCIQQEFEQDNDYQGIQKICSAIVKHNYSKEQMNALFQEIKQLFFSGGQYEAFRSSILIGLKRLLMRPV